MEYSKIKVSEEELEILYLPPRLPAEDVVKKIRIPIKSNFTDRIDLNLTPYLKFPISLIGKNHVHWIFAIAPTQSGKTVLLQVFVADSIDQEPGTMIYALPDKISGAKAMEDKLIGMIKASPELYKRVRSSRDLATTKITLDNMTIYPSWGGSIASSSSITCKRGAIDEVRLMKKKSGNESNVIKFVNDRVTTYFPLGLGQCMAVSTPAIQGDLLHQQLSVRGTLVLMWHHTCTNCRQPMLLDFFKNVKIIDGKVRCVCLKCGNFFRDDDKKREMNSLGFYAPDDGSFKLPTEFPERVVVWWDSLASPFRSFEAIYNEYLATKPKLHDYMNFMQAWLARFWVDDISKTSIVNLEKKQVEEGRGVVPSWCRVITAGIDTQDSGFYVVVRAWGSKRKTRVIDTFFIECSLNTSDAKDVKSVIDRDIDSRIYLTRKNERWMIAKYAIDTGGHRTKQIYEGTASFSRIVWVKGARDSQRTTITYSKDYNLYLVKTSEYLDETEDKSTSGSFELHKGISKDYLAQFCNRRKVKKWSSEDNIPKIVWKAVGQFDYRMADIHSFICLDIPTSDGTYRHELEKEGFFVNPLQKAIEENAVITYSEDEDDSENIEEEFEIGSFGGGWYA
jgi:phage terminase large subunit GpA-like protein